MSNSRFTHRYPLNIPGKYYINDQCTDCDLCRESAPNNIRRDDRTGYSYVFKQPTAPEEIASVEEGVAGCPTEAVANDGDQFDWNFTPIFDWNALLRKHNTDVHFDLHAPLLREDTKRPWWKFW
jgi:ferredoxin